MSGNPLFTSFLVLYFLTLDINVTHSTCLECAEKMPYLAHQSGHPFCLL